METKISKIQFRQDTAENWTNLNPVLACGEPAYELPTAARPVGGYKIGDGVTPWTNLPYASTLGTEIQDVTLPSNDLYARQYLPNGTPHWTTFHLPVVDERKDFSDLMAQPYDQELNMHYNQMQINGETRPVYGIKKRFTITASSSQIVTNQIVEGAANLLAYGGYVTIDDEVYALPATSTTDTAFNVKVYIDEVDAPGVISVSSITNVGRTQAPLDIWVLYTKSE